MNLSFFLENEGEWLCMVTGKEYPAIIGGKSLVDQEEFINKRFMLKGIWKIDKNECEYTEQNPFTFFSSQ